MKKPRKPETVLREFVARDFVIACHRFGSCIYQHDALSKSCPRSRARRLIAELRRSIKAQGDRR